MIPKKILYAVQATGNGHLSRCLEFHPILSKYTEVDVLLSGIQGDLEMPFPVKYRFHGLGYIFGTKGGINYWATAKTLKPLRLLKDIFKLDLSPYDMVVNDFEPISAYARKWRFKHLPCVSLSHQAAFYGNNIPRPKRKGYLAEFIFKYFAPSTKKIGLHFQEYDENIYTPVIRQEIRKLPQSYIDNEVLVYLPSFDHNRLKQFFVEFPEYNFRVFSKHTQAFESQNNVYIYPVDNSNWMEMLSKCSYAIMGAGFQGASEMLFMNKKLLVIPMLAQYEQECNAKALSDLGVQVIESINDDFGFVVKKWLAEAKVTPVDFPDHTDFLVRKALGI